jgi:hypothetical protein
MYFSTLKIAYIGGAPQSENSAQNFHVGLGFTKEDGFVFVNIRHNTAKGPNVRFLCVVMSFEK